jgi:hypothetical protein
MLARVNVCAGIMLEGIIVDAAADITNRIPKLPRIIFSLPREVTACVCTG